MEEQTNLRQEGLSSTQSSTEENNNLIYLNELVQGGPLRVIGNTDQGYCIVLGKYRISQICKTEDEARGQLIYNNWEMIINLIGAITGQTQEIKDRMKN